MSQPKRKTWSRETALILMAVFCWTVYSNNVGMAEVIVWPITTYAAIAFGLKRIDESDGVWGVKRDIPLGVREND